MSQYIRDSRWGPDEFKRTKEYCLQEAQDIYETYKNNEQMVFFKETITDKDYSRWAMMEWCKKYKDCQELSGFFNKLKDLHETRLVKRGLLKEHSEGITKMVLQNVHNWESKQTLDTIVRESDPLKDKLKKVMDGEIEIVYEDGGHKIKEQQRS